MSELAQKIAGTYIADDRSPKPPVTAWIQHELRDGVLSQFMDAFIAGQTEPLARHLALVDAIQADRVLGHIPCAIYDSESPHVFHSEVAFELNPVSGTIRRLQ